MSVKVVAGLQKAPQTRSNAAKRRQRENSVKVIRWLFLCFPHGLSLMWRRSCGWHIGVKYAITGLLAAALAAVVLIPSPNGRRTGGVEMIGVQRDVEIYGPELPQVVPEEENYRYNTRTSILVSPDEIPEQEIVYAAKDGQNYHRFSCKFAYASSQALSPYEAMFLGYTPCKMCRPPVYNAEDVGEEASEEGEE